QRRGGNTSHRELELRATLGKRGRGDSNGGFGVARRGSLDDLIRNGGGDDRGGGEREQRADDASKRDPRGQAEPEWSHREGPLGQPAGCAPSETPRPSPDPPPSPTLTPTPATEACAWAPP